MNSSSMPNVSSSKLMRISPSTRTACAGTQDLRFSASESPLFTDPPPANVKVGIPFTSDQPQAEKVLATMSSSSAFEKGGRRLGGATPRKSRLDDEFLQPSSSSSISTRTRSQTPTQQMQTPEMTATQPPCQQQQQQQRETKNKNTVLQHQQDLPETWIQTIYHNSLAAMRYHYSYHPHFITSFIIILLSLILAWIGFRQPSSSSPQHQPQTTPPPTTPTDEATFPATRIETVNCVLENTQGPKVLDLCRMVYVKESEGERWELVSESKSAMREG